jgi:hypothetical protein
MKKLSKIVVRSIEFLNEQEMKNVIGGVSTDTETVPENMSARERACYGKYVGDECAWDNGLTLSFGYCQNFGTLTRLHCSKVNRTPFRPK